MSHHIFHFWRRKDYLIIEVPLFDMYLYATLIQPSVHGGTIINLFIALSRYTYGSDTAFFVRNAAFFLLVNKS